MTREPTRLDLATTLALRALAERREEDALAPVAEAVRRAPRDPTLLHCLGLLHRAVGDLAPALAAFDAALTIDPNAAKLVHARAQAALEAGTESLEWFDRARRLAPNDGDVILGQAAALLATQRTDDADALLADMLAQHPGWIPGHEALVRLRHARRGVAAPTELLDRAIADAPRDQRLHAVRIVVAHRAGLGDAALAALAAARTALGDSPLVRELGAIVASEYAARSVADAAFGRVDPGSSVDLAIHWLRHLLRRGEPERASTFAATLAGPARDAAWPYVSLAWRLLEDPRARWLDDPELVRVFDLDLPDRELARLAERLRTLHVSEAQPLDQSVRGGTQTDGPLFSRLDPEIASLKRHIRRALDRYLTELPHRDPAHPLTGRLPRYPRFVGSWSVRLAGGGHHDAHVHTDGVISSACYIALPDPPGELTLGEPQASLGLNLPPLRTVTPAAGRLVLFPSTLWHATRPFADGERLTVAFDVA